VLLTGLAMVLTGPALADVGGARPAPHLAVAPLSGPAGTGVSVRGAGFPAGRRGVVVLGARRVAAFRATRAGTFRVGFVAPAGDGLLRLAVRRVVRARHGSARHGSLHRHAWAVADFRVVVNVPIGGGVPVGALGAAGGSAGAGVGVGIAPVAPVAPLVPATPAAPVLPPTPVVSPGGGAKSPTEGTKGSGSKGSKGATGSEGAKGAEGTKGSEEPKGSEGTKGTEEPEGSKPKEPEEPKGTEEPKGASGSWWIPPQHLTWYWQLQGTINNDEPVEAYDVDGFENSASEVAALHALSKHVICYIDVGTYEPGRADSDKFPASVQGAGVEGWPGEKWLDIGNLAVLEPIMTARFQMCKEKGFDAVEPDNMDGFENNDGFNNTAAQQLTYDEWVADEVHSLGMAVLQKNDGEQTKQLEPYFDGALDEQCNQYSECANFQAYLTAGKPVLNAEYDLSTSSFCAADNAAGIMGARYDLELDGKTFEPCW
jgi:hypothetical protein